MGPNGPYTELIYLIGISYEGRIDSYFNFVYKSVLVITQGYMGINKYGL